MKKLMLIALVSVTVTSIWGAAQHVPAASGSFGNDLRNLIAAHATTQKTIGSISNDEFAHISQKLSEANSTDDLCEILIHNNPWTQQLRRSDSFNNNLHNLIAKRANMCATRGFISKEQVALITTKLTAAKDINLLCAVIVDQDLWRHPALQR